MTTVKEKRKSEQNEDSPSPKSHKKDKESKTKKSEKVKFAKPSKPSAKPKTANGNNKSAANNSKKTGDDKKPEDWNEFKKQKKELRLKRKQSKSLFEVMNKAKKLSETLRMRRLPGGQEARDNLIKELHSLLRENYVKFALTHDVARVVQLVLKYANQEIRKEIYEELTPSTVQILQSKYGRFCMKACLTYGNPTVRSAIIRATYGNAVKLVSHAVSAPVFEQAYSKYSHPQERIHLTQEFFGDMYKQSKDNGIRHLRDVYKDSPDMKDAVLTATKSNLTRILNKDLLDSGLVQSVLSQYLSECKDDDRAELITQLAPHAVVLSNSKDGARTVMRCFWNGTNKDRKVIVKAIKQNVLDVAKHEHGHTCIISLLDSADDTVLLNKAILTDVLSHAPELASNEWGRKVLLWMVAPNSSTHFHPSFTKELQNGRESSTCKKSVEVRRSEILDFAVASLLDGVASDAKSWLANPSVAIVTVAILKTGKGEKLREALSKIADVIVDQDWKIQKNSTSISGIEDAGLHMSLKALCKNDKILLDENSEVTFGEVLLEKLGDEVVKSWLASNRGCFLLVCVLENGSSPVRNELKQKLKSHVNLMRKLNLPGSKILLEKMKS